MGRSGAYGPSDANSAMGMRRQVFALAMVMLCASANAGDVWHSREFEALQFLKNLPREWAGT